MRVASAKLRLVLTALCVGALVVAVVASFLAGLSTNARIERIASNGIAVQVVVVDCRGEIGGSGSTSAGYTCHGTYRIGHHSYDEVIGSQTTFVEAGRRLSALVDPLNRHTVVVASMARSAHPSPRVFVPSAVLVALLGALIFLLLRRRPAPTPTH